MTIINSFLNISNNISKYFPVDHQPFHDQFDLWRKEQQDLNSPENGVYILISDKSIGRVLGEDFEGILYIGKGVILPYHNRVGKFINSCNKTEAVHDAGVRYSNMTYYYTIDSTRVLVILSENCDELEAQLLTNYLNEFGEVPPLNMRSETKK